MKFTISDNIIISDIHGFLRILTQFRLDGKQKLQILSDFDYTLTKYKTENQSRNFTSHSIIDSSPFLPIQTRNKAREYRDTYHKYELNSSISDELSEIYMNQWWSSTHKLLIENRTSKELIETIAKTTNISFRNYVTDFFALCVKYNINLCIFSAGITQVIDDLLRFQCDFNIKNNEKHTIIANNMIFDERNFLKEFSSPLITSATKSITKISREVDYTLQQNVILLGDIIRDSEMCDINGYSILRVGFLNDQIEERLDSFLNSFDIVILNDGDFQFINRLLEIICNKETIYSFSELIYALTVE
ncbi:hypothetical protein WA158_002076 [Blastocystis sp. Blastoise]